MLKSIYIKDYLLISEVQIEFDSGLTVVTGETGAGKSLVADSLALVMGARVAGNVVRSGCNFADITVIFELKSSEAINWLQESALLEGYDCIIRRLIYTNRPARSYINGRPVTLKSVRNLATLLVEIHGQHEQNLLSKAAMQRRLFDAYIGQIDQVKTLAKTAEKIRSEESKRRQLSENESQLRSALELVRHQYQEIAQLAPEQDEFAQLKSRLSRVSNSDELIRTLNYISQELFYQHEQTISNILNDFVDQLTVLSEYEKKLESVSELLNEAIIRVDESAREMNFLSSQIEHDPAEIDTLESRMSELHHQARIHQTDPNRLPELQQELATEIERLEFQLNEIKEFDSGLEQLKKEYQVIAGKIQEARRIAAPRFTNAVTDQFQYLGMNGASFEVNLNDHQSNVYSNFGYENVEFLIATNPGQEKGSIGAIASGGELSRISLAIQVVAADTTQVPTVVFDEIDVGIGGSVAERIGNLLRELSHHVQILCITHLPQVAAQGHNQLNVVKSVEEDSKVSIHSLDYQERVNEIARMLGGVKITTRTTEHAKEMLSQCE